MIRLRQTLRTRGTWALVVLIALCATTIGLVSQIAAATLAESLPYPNVSRLVVISKQSRGGLDLVFDAELATWATSLADLADVGGFTVDPLAVTGDFPAQRVLRASVTENVPDILGLQLLAGRQFARADFDRQVTGPALVSEGLARRMFGAASDAIGRRVKLDRTEVSIVGVVAGLPRFPVRVVADVIVPWALPEGPVDNRPVLFVSDVVARLRPTASLTAFSSRLHAIDADLTKAAPAAVAEDLRSATLAVTPLKDVALAASKPALRALLILAAIIILTAAGNVGGLQVARSIARQEEVLLRVTLGATPSRVMLDIVLESLVISLTAVAASSAMMWIVVRLVGSFASVAGFGLAVPAVGPVGVLVALQVSVISSILLALIPIIMRRGRRIVKGQLSSRGALGPSRAANRIYQGTVVTQVACAAVLLTAALLLATRLRTASQVEVGMDPTGVWTATIALPADSYRQRERQSALFIQTVAALDAELGESAVALASSPPTSIASLTQTSMGSQQVRATVVGVSGAYFALGRIKPIEGRVLTSNDDAQPVAVVSARYAQSLGSSTTVLGQLLELGDGQVRTVVGIVPDVILLGGVGQARPRVFIPFVQRLGTRASLLIRPATDVSDSLEQTVRTLLSQLDRNVALYDAVALEKVISRPLQSIATNTTLLSIVGTMVCVIAACGVFAMNMFVAATKQREIGLRLALGASQGAILRARINGILLISSIGAAAGVAAAWWTHDVIDRIAGAPTSLWGPASAAALAVVVLSIAAALPSALRMASIDPWTALKD